MSFRRVTRSAPDTVVRIRCPMPRILLEVATHDHWFVPRLVDTTAVERGKSYRAGPVAITYRGGHAPKAPNAPEVYRFAITWQAGESESLVARWLHAKVKGRAERIRINRREVRAEEEDILHALREATPGFEAD